MTASWVRQRAKDHPVEETPLCPFFERLEESRDRPEWPQGALTMEDLREWGRQHGLCPYFVARRAMKEARVIIYSYYYLLDPKIAELVSKGLESDAIVVFDEAHNIDNVCIEALSVELSRPLLDAASRCVVGLEERVRRLRRENADTLQREYAQLLEQLSQRPALPGAAEETDRLLGDPTLPAELLEQAVPGNMRKAEHFLSLLKRLIEWIKTRLKPLHVTTDTAIGFIGACRRETQIDARSLVLCSERLTSLLRTLQVTPSAASEEAPGGEGALQRLAHFVTLAAQYAPTQSFLLLMEPFDEQTPNRVDPRLHLCCLDASLAMSLVLQRFRTVIITSGTLSPLDMYPRLLAFEPALMQSFPMSMARNNVNPLVTAS